MAVLVERTAVERKVGENCVYHAPMAGKIWVLRF